MKIETHRFPSRVLIALDVAPLVRLGHLTDREGRWLVEHRYRMKLVELRRTAA